MLSVIIPTYNERDNMFPLISRLATVLPKGSEIIVVDDNSPDGTAAVVEKLSSRFPALLLVKRTRKQGLTSAIVAGVSVSHGERLVVMDADLSHPPEAVPALASALSGHDLVIGNRLLKGGGIKTWPLHRRLISWSAQALARILLGVKLTDPMSGFFAVRRNVFMKTRFRTRGYKLLLNILADNPRMRVKELPYTFSDRHSGRTKLGAAEMVVYLLDLLRIKSG
jgi:dolichol-phosphate mannosyltransferase